MLKSIRRYTKINIYRDTNKVTHGVVWDSSEEKEFPQVTKEVRNTMGVARVLFSINSRPLYKEKRRWVKKYR